MSCNDSTASSPTVERTAAEIIEELVEFGVDLDKLSQHAAEIEAVYQAVRGEAPEYPRDYPPLVTLLGRLISELIVDVDAAIMNATTIARGPGWACKADPDDDLAAKAIGRFADRLSTSEAPKREMHKEEVAHE